MPLDNTSPSITAFTAPVKLAPAKWSQVIKDYVAAKALKKARDSEARAADTQVKNLRATLTGALAGSASAMCGHAMLTLKTGSPADASLTLHDGSKITWSAVQAVTIKGRRITANEIASIYGGRAASVDLEVTGSV